MFDTIHAGEDVLVAEHDPFGVACGAAGVDHRRHVARSDGGLASGQGLGLGVGAARLLPVVEGRVILAGGLGAVDDADGLEGRQVGEDVLHLVQHRLILDDEVAHLAVGQDITVFLFADGGVDGHEDCTCLLRGHVDEVPFRAVARDEYQMVSRLETQMHQAVADGVDIVGVLLDIVFVPLGSAFCHEDGAVGVCLSAVVYQVE